MLTEPVQSTTVCASRLPSSCPHRTRTTKRLSDGIVSASATAGCGASSSEEIRSTSGSPKAAVSSVIWYPPYGLSRSIELCQSGAAGFDSWTPLGVSQPAANATETPATRSFAIACFAVMLRVLPDEGSKRAGQRSRLRGTVVPNSSGGASPARTRPRAADDVGAQGLVVVQPGGAGGAARSGLYLPGHRTGSSCTGTNVARGGKKRRPGSEGSR